MRTFNIIFLLTFFSTFLSAQMHVLDPQDWWSDSPAAVENVEFEIRPAGVYAEVAVSWDLKAVDWWNNSFGVQLEYVHDFVLPQDAVVNDSWLWIGSYISAGEIYEKNEGTAIYEAIVDRRQDPSILTKVSPKDYHFRVYPLLPDSTRRVRLSYLIPMDISDGAPQVDLPYASFFAGSELIPESIQIEVHDDLNWYHQELVGPLTEKERTASSTIYQVNPGQILEDVVINYSSDVPDKEIYFGTYEARDGDKYFQMVYKPDIEIDVPPSYNMIVLDYDKENCQGFTQSSVLNELKEELLALSDNDFFSIVYSDWVSEFTSDVWVSATQDEIDTAIEKISSDGMDDISNLENLLPQALNFIEENGKDSRLIILNASVTPNRAWEADPLLERVSDFIDQMQESLTIDVVDYTNANRDRVWINNDAYYGSEYFLTRLAQLNSGEYTYAPEELSLSSALSDKLSARPVYLEEYKIDLDTESGFVYGLYSSDNGSGIDVSQSIFMTGKYYGEYPFTLDLEYVVDGEFYSENIIMQESDLHLNNLAEDVWHANYILENEYRSDAATQSSVIETSMEHRLLSASTVYLCLEPDTTAISANNEEGDGGILIATEDESETIDVSVYPNPFVSEFTVEIPKRFAISARDIKVSLLDMQGQIVSDLSESIASESDIYKIVWEDSMNTSAGMYILRISNGDRVVNKKIVKLGM